MLGLLSPGILNFSNGQKLTFALETSTKKQCGAITSSWILRCVAFTSSNSQAKLANQFCFVLSQQYSLSSTHLYHGEQCRPTRGWRQWPNERARRVYSQGESYNEMYRALSCVQSYESLCRIWKCKNYGGHGLVVCLVVVVVVVL